MQIFSYRMIVWSILISKVIMSDQPKIGISSNTVADDQLVLFLAPRFVACALHTASKVYNINSHNCLLVILIQYLFSFYLMKTKLKKKKT